MSLLMSTTSTEIVQLGVGTSLHLQLSTKEVYDHKRHRKSCKWCEMYGKCKRKPPWEFPQSCPACPGQHRRAASGRHQSPRKWRKQLLVVETVEVAELGKKMGRLILFIILFLTRLTRPVDFFVTNMVSWQILKGLALSWTIGDHVGPFGTGFLWHAMAIGRYQPPLGAQKSSHWPLADLSSKSSESHWTHKTHESHGNIWQHMATSFHIISCNMNGAIPPVDFRFKTSQYTVCVSASIYV